jgi:hypothetical protein
MLLLVHSASGCVKLETAGNDTYVDGGGSTVKLVQIERDTLENGFLRAINEICKTANDNATFAIYKMLRTRC